MEEYSNIKTNIKDRVWKDIKSVMWLRMGARGCSCLHDNEPLDSNIKRTNSRVTECLSASELGFFTMELGTCV
jgi:hypothetical protein